MSFVGDSVEPEPSFPPSMVVDRSLSSTGPFTPVGPPTSMTNVSRGVVKDEPGLTHSIGEMADPKSGSGISAFSVLPPGENMHVQYTVCSFFMYIASLNSRFPESDTKKLIVHPAKAVADPGGGGGVRLVRTNPPF